MLRAVVKRSGDLTVIVYNKPKGVLSFKPPKKGKEDWIRGKSNNIP